MTKRFNLKLENNTESSIAVVQSYRKVMMQDDVNESLALVHYRGGEEEFHIGASYLSSSDPIDRALGADVLAQLGWQDRTYLAESVDLLIPALQDEDEFVVYHVCCALGHRSDPKAIPHVLKLAQSKNENIRYGVVFALLGQDSQDAVEAMIALSKDSDLDVRNWAMFGLGSQIEADTPEIRDALLLGALDSDSEIRGEALVGLAQRKDKRAIDLLLNEWETHADVSILSLEAAEVVASHRLYSKLVYLQKTFEFAGDTQFTSQLQSAIDSCKPKIEQVKSVGR